MKLLEKTGTGKALIAAGTIALLIIVFAAFLIKGEKLEKKDEFKPERPVKSIIVKSNSDSSHRSFPAVVKEKQEVELAFRVGGLVKELNAATGKRFKKGEIIAKIDQRDFKVRILKLNAALSGAQSSLKAMKTGARPEDIISLTAALDASKARFERAEKALERSKKLLARSFTTQAAHDMVVEQYRLSRSALKESTQNLIKAKKGARFEEIEVAEANIRQLKADLSAANNALEDTVLRAPFDGIVNRKYIEAYENIPAGKPVVSFLDFSRTEIETSVPEEVMLKRNSLKRMYSVIDAYPDIRIESRLSEIGLKTSGNNQSFPLKADLVLPADIDIKPGMTATLFIEYEKGAQTGYSLPLSSVYSDPDGDTCVWKVNPNMTVSSVKLKTGPVRDGKIVVLSGINDGERVVTAGARFLMKGQKVRLMEDVL